MKSVDKFPALKDFHILLACKRSFNLDPECCREICCRNHLLCGWQCIILSIGQFASEYSCFHAEANTDMFYIYRVLLTQGYKKAVILDTEDTDNYVHTAYVSHQISGVLCIKGKTQIIDTKSQCNKEMAASLIPLHVITACDHNSGFYGVSKKVISDRIQTRKETHDLLAYCGTELPASKEVLDDLKKFAMWYVYCDTEKMTLAELRAAKWRAQKKKIHFLRIPTVFSSTWNGQTISEASNPQFHPSPLGHGWQFVDGLCLPVRYDLSALPSSIPVTLNMTDDEKRHMDSECDSEKVDSYSSDFEFTDSSIVQPVTMTTMIDNGYSLFFHTIVWIINWYELIWISYYNMNIIL